MLKVKFAYNEPLFGDLEVNGRREDFTNDELIDLFETMRPEAIDIEILEVVEVNG